MSGLPLEVDLDWEGDLRVAARVGAARLVLDSAGQAGPSPVQALAAGLAGCMAIDVVHILRRGRVALTGLRAHLSGRRSEADPKRLESVDLRFVATGDVAPEKLERAIALSRETYCSVWHSLRQDIEFRTSFEVRGE